MNYELPNGGHAKWLGRQPDGCLHYFTLTLPRAHWSPGTAPDIQPGSHCIWGDMGEAWNVELLCSAEDWETFLIWCNGQPDKARLAAAEAAGREEA